MAFNGYLIKVGGSSGTVLPMKHMRHESYKATPDQRLETDAKRDLTGLLHRNTVEHTATKIEIETPVITNIDLQSLLTILRSHWSNQLERKVTIQYYNEETDGYKTAECYVPDIDYTIDHIDLTKNIVFYKPVRIAFIEY